MKLFTEEESMDAILEILGYAFLLVIGFGLSMLRDRADRVPVQYTVVCYSLLIIGWIIKFFIDYRLCGILGSEVSRFCGWHMLHNILTVLCVYHILTYNEYWNFYGSIFLYIGISAELAFFVLLAYLLSHSKVFTPKKVLYYGIAGITITLVCFSTIKMASLIGAKEIGVRQLEIRKLEEVSKKGFSYTYVVTLKDEKGYEDQFHVSEDKYYEYVVGQSIKVKEYKGLTKLTFSRLE